MVLVLVELGSTVEVQDLISFLLLRSYNNFRVTDRDPFVSGTVHASSFNATNLSQSSTRAFHTTQLQQNTDSFQNSFIHAEPDHMEHLESTSNTLISRRPDVRQVKEHGRRCFVSSDDNYIPSYSEASELVEENEMGRNDLSLEVPSKPQSLIPIMEKETRSHEDVKASNVLSTVSLPSYSTSKHLIEKRDSDGDDLSIDVGSDSQCVSAIEGSELICHQTDYDDSFDMRRLRKILLLLKKRKALTSSAKCAICDKNIVVSARSLILHINHRHTKFHLYGCAVCHYSTLSRGNAVKHIRRHTRAVGGDLTAFLDANVVKIPISQDKLQKFEEMLEICFGIRLDCCDQ